ncbi:nonsense-mediated mRNA decay factor SMG7-like isoform X2 [Musa acuminata AAA Group]|uniref:nonsense-mediated mRNA decay factor SMG7-like isoform X2 n=1 Tax=Musa acuminata AAA Group TaxID=214697 RepID=UPI0031DF453D
MGDDLSVDGTALSSWDLAQRRYDKNVELEERLRRSASSKVPSDPNIWLQMRENYEAIILEDHDFSQKHDVEYTLWRLHYRRIEEFRAHLNVAASAGSNASPAGKGHIRPDRIKKIRNIFKSFLTEATGFYHDLILKIRAKYGLPFSYLDEGPENQTVSTKDEKRSAKMKKGLLSCHRCLIYLGDLARYKGLYGGDSVSRDYAAASGYYLQAASLCPSSGNPHHQLAILASYSGDELLAIYRYFRSLEVESPFSTARDNLIIAFEKNRQNYSQLPRNLKVPSGRAPGTGGQGTVGGFLAKDSEIETIVKEQDLTISEVFRSFCIHFLRFSGILFTRTSLETCGEILSSVISDLHLLLSSGPDDVVNFGSDVAENALFILRLVAIVIFSVHNVKRESENQSYAKILQHTVLLQNAFTAAFEFAGYITKRCTELHDAASSFLLPAILIFIEWLACHPDAAAGINVDEKQASARSFFWSQCVSLTNKLMLTGFASIVGADDETCFFNTSKYDVGESGDHLALWEDFELRGFLPLVPAQVILDFSRKRVYGNDGFMEDKSSRVQRIIAALRALMNVVSIDQQRIYFDSNLKKFVVATEPPLSKDHVDTDFLDVPETNDINQACQIQSLAEVGATLSSMPGHDMTLCKLQPHIEGEEEEEIVFKPTVFDKDPNVIASKSTVQDVNSIQVSASGHWTPYVPELPGPPISVHFSSALNVSSQLQTTGPNVSQMPLQFVNPDASKWSADHEAFLHDGLKKMNAIQNGHFGNQMLKGFPNDFHPTPFSFVPPDLGAAITLPSHLKATEVMVPSILDTMVHSGATFDGLSDKLTAAVPASRRNPVSRPVRHLGPPPGFGHASFNENVRNSVLKNQKPQTDAYSWLDGHQAPSVQGKQVSKSPPQMEAERSSQDFRLFEQLKPYAEKQLQQTNLQHPMIPEQYQSLWSGR